MSLFVLHKERRNNCRLKNKSACFTICFLAPENWGACYWRCSM